MLPIIWVFKGEHSAFLLDFFTNRGYAPYYDDLHRDDTAWMCKLEAHRKYAVDGDFLMNMSNGSPDMIVVGEFTANEWYHINAWMNFEMFASVVEPYNAELVERIFEKPMKIRKENDVVNEVSMAPEFTKVEGSYGFTKEYLEEQDTMLYQVDRPGTFLPFTVVVSDFKRKGHVYFFSDIYGSNSWDANRQECRFDYLFLQNVWTHLELPGEFTMNVVKERVDKCYPERLAEGIPPEAEPVVYRTSIEKVKATLAKKWGLLSTPAQTLALSP